MKLYNHFRSSASWRVRIALAIKELDYDYLPVQLAKRDQLADDFTARSASRPVPLLEDGDARLTQSLAIIEYLEEAHPQPPLLPPDPLGRARVRAIAQDIACEIHPLIELRLLRYLVHDLKLSEDDQTRWVRHWVETGLEAVERVLAAQPSRFCHGDAPTLADCTLVPQIFNAQRFDCRTDHLPQLMRVFDACMQLDAFAHTQPSVCPDAA